MYSIKKLLLNVGEYSVPLETNSFFLSQRVISSIIRVKKKTYEETISITIQNLATFSNVPIAISISVYLSHIVPK